MSTAQVRGAMRPLAEDDPRLDRLPRAFRYFDSGGHLYRLRDSSAGPRRYSGSEA